MAYSSKPASFNKILLIVFGVAFGLVALAFGYQAVKTSSDLRSKAVQDMVDYQRWEFASDTEGWTGIGTSGLTATGGALSAQVISGSAFMSPKVNVSLPEGNKYIVIRMQATANTSATNQGNTCVVSSSGETVCPPANNSRAPGFAAGGPPGGGTANNNIPTTVPFTEGYLSLTVRYAGPEQIGLMIGQPGKANPNAIKDAFPLQIPLDGQMHDYTIQIPVIDALVVKGVNISVDAGAMGDQMLIDSVRLMGGQALQQPNNPTPTSGAVIPTGIILVQTPGTQNNANPPTNTNTTNTTNVTTSNTISWNDCINTAGSRIQQTYPRTCVTPDGRRATESTTAIQPTTAPPSGCYYQQVQCVKAPCNPILVCPTTAPTSVVPKPTISWNDCINTPGSIIQQTYPRVCVTQDGRRATEPTTGTTPTPTPTYAPKPFPSPKGVTPTPTYAPYPMPSPGGNTWSICLTTTGRVILNTYPRICVLPNGTRVIEPTTLTNNIIHSVTTAVTSVFQLFFGR